MKYEAPKMEIVAISADVTVANEIEVDMSALLSKNIPA